MAQDKRHLTTEQLSAFLDKEVSAEEQAQWEAHLSTCPQCQQALASLRQTVALLNALPAPVLPRSFVLPAESAAPVTLPKAAAPTPIRSAQRKLNPNVRRILRTMSAFAAVIGAVFFLSALLPALVHGSSGSYTTLGTVHSSAFSGVAAPRNTPHETQTNSADTQKNLSPIATVTPTIRQAVQPQPAGIDHKQPKTIAQPPTSSSLPTLFIFNLSSAAGRLGLGMLLVILGLMGFALFKR